MAIARTVLRGSIVRLGREAAEIHGAWSTWIRPAGDVGRSLAIIAVAAFAILVLLPAAVAVQAAIP